MTLAGGSHLPSKIAEPPDLAGFVASLSSAWRAGEIRRTFSAEAKPRYLRGLQSVVQSDVARMPDSADLRRTRQAGLPRVHHDLATGVPPPRRLSEYHLRATVRRALCAYAAPTCAGLAPGGYSATDLQGAGPYTGCQPRSASVMAMVHASPASAALGVQTGLRLTADKAPQPKRPSPAGNIAGEAAGNRVT